MCHCHGEVLRNSIFKIPKFSTLGIQSSDCTNTQTELSYDNRSLMIQSLERMKDRSRDTEVEIQIQRIQSLVNTNEVVTNKLYGFTPDGVVNS